MIGGLGHGVHDSAGIKELVVIHSTDDELCRDNEDFLIAPDGAVVARKYGERIDDQWSVDEILKLVTA